MLHIKVAWKDAESTFWNTYGCVAGELEQNAIWM